MNISCYYDIKLKIINFMSLNFYIPFCIFTKPEKNIRVIEPQNFYDIIDYTFKNTKIHPKTQQKSTFFV